VFCDLQIDQELYCMLYLIIRFSLQRLNVYINKQNYNERNLKCYKHLKISRKRNKMVYS